MPDWIPIAEASECPPGTSIERVAAGRMVAVANVDGTNAADISVSRYSAAALGGTAFPVASTISVPADASLIVADATTPIMLAANTSLGATAGTSNTITMTVTYQEFAG